MSERFRFHRSGIEVLGDILLALTGGPLNKSELYAYRLRTNATTFYPAMASLLDKGYVAESEAYWVRGRRWEKKMKRSQYSLTQSGRKAATKYAKLKSMV